MMKHGPGGNERPSEWKQVGQKNSGTGKLSKGNSRRKKIRENLSNELSDS